MTFVGVLQITIKEFEEGDIRQFSQLALNNTAVYQSYPTAEITPH